VKRVLWWIGAILLPAGGAPVIAADDGQVPIGGDRQVTGPLWELGLGAAALRLPDYRGSDHSRNSLLPLPYLVYRGEWLRADREGARALLVRTDRVKLDISAAATVPSDSQDNAARRGIADLAATVEVGPNLNLELLESADRSVRLELRLPLRAAFTLERSPHAIGYTFSPNLNLDISGVAGGWHVGLLGGPLYADRRYHQLFYGVAASDATSGRPVYAAPGGYAGWQALAATSRRIGSAWVGAFVRYDSLSGAVFEASPLMRRTHEVTAGIGVAWVFAASDRLVTIDD
jgi:outer membrane scaffolding protein for murein synthesis (MipA/OmpV family)